MELGKSEESFMQRPQNVQKLSCEPNTQEPEARGLTQAPGQPGLEWGSGSNTREANPNNPKPSDVKKIVKEFFKKEKQNKTKKPPEAQWTKPTVLKCFQLWLKH